MIRDSELMTRQWQCGVNLPTYSPTIIAKEAFSLFQRSYSWQRPIRSVTVRAINLAPADGSFQLDLFTDAEKQAKAEALDKAITEYDDTIVRQMIECIKVYGDKRIEVIFGGGTSIIEEL